MSDSYQFCINRSNQILKIIKWRPDRMLKEEYNFIFKLINIFLIITALSSYIFSKDDLLDFTSTLQYDTIQIQKTLIFAYKYLKWSKNTSYSVYYMNFGLENLHDQYLWVLFYQIEFFFEHFELFITYILLLKSAWLFKLLHELVQIFFIIYLFICSFIFKFWLKKFFFIKM